MPIIYKINNPEYRDKMLGLDYDHTIVQPKNGKTFPKNVEDWEWLYESVPSKIISYYENNFMIVIFTNQSKEWKLEQIKTVSELLKIPIFISIGFEKSEYKPNIILYTKLFEKEVNKSESLFIGDALGRKTDFSDSDKVFAENLEIKYLAPEEFFDTNKKLIILPKIKKCKEPEIIILVGYPGSGKTTIATIFEERGYEIIHGDDYKTQTQMIKKANNYTNEKKSIVFDATNNNKKKRLEYINFGNANNYKIRCIHINTSLEESYKRNKQRLAENQVPKIAYNVYTKYFEEPNENEGFKLLII
jgi:bifunctional polynucleotide phosphatase/kinase